MKRDEYLDKQDVKDFINWAAKLVTGEWGLVQSWKSKDKQGRNPCSWSCESLYKAYKKYFWKGDSFEDMATLFDKFGLGLQVSEHSTVGDMKKFLDTANEVIEWGRTQKPESLYELERELDTIRLMNKLLEVQHEIPITKNERLSIQHDSVGRLERLMIDHPNRLNPEWGDTDELMGFKYMSAGYSKIYSAMIKDFPIYDSRVGCGLASLIWLFFEDQQSDSSRELLML